MAITGQDEFNQAVCKALYNLYILTIPGADDCGEDADFREIWAEMDAYAFPRDPNEILVIPEPPLVQ